MEPPMDMAAFMHMKAIYDFTMKRLEEKQKEEDNARKRAEAEAEDEDREMGVEPVDKKQPRWNARWFYLTYAQTKDTALKHVLEELEERMNISEYHICQEKHKDGQNHIHALIKLDKRTDVRNPRYFDLFQWPGTDEFLFHCNIRVPSSRKDGDQKGSLAKIKKYIYKGQDGKPPVVITNVHFDWSSDGNFIRRKADYEMKKELLEMAHKPEWFEGITWWGHEFKMQPPGSYVRKRHYYIYGPALCGKSTLMDEIEKRAQIYPVSALGHGTNANGVWDEYKQERYIFINDVDNMLTKDVLCNVSDVKEGQKKRPVYARFRNPLFNKEVTMFIFANDTPGYHRGEDWTKEAWFTTRFTIIELGQTDDVDEDGNRIAEIRNMW